jgi:anthranilate/para-aminobenzoate synthase component I
MKPLICFYKNDLFIYSYEYSREECGVDVSVVDFLKSIERDHAREMKVIQLNFEFDQQNLFAGQTELYPAAKATVFFLKKFDLLNWDEVLKRLKPSPIKVIPEFKSLIKKSEFIEKVALIIRHIKAGRLYQANLTAALSCASSEPSESLFAHFQNFFRGQYKAFLPLENVDVLCFSPELFLQQERQVLTTKPIKGSLEKNKDFNNDLMKSTKENAELSMIVDLLRNDLNSVSDLHSAKVISHREKMQLGYIQHTYSEISVYSESPLSHVIGKTFPGGSISGCPKIESLKVIREVESVKRQVYTGSLGWWQNNDFCLNIAIRSLIHHDDNLFYNAGCGIVYDSTPDAEWEEFLLKTGALNVK